MADEVGIAGHRVRSFVERIEQLEAEIAELSEGKKEVFAEAKGEGFDVKILLGQNRGKDWGLDCDEALEVKGIRVLHGRSSPGTAPTARLRNWPGLSKSTRPASPGCCASLC
jgi:hypothetical protein